jgi:DNA-binding YbaB/EbfC family protein
MLKGLGDIGNLMKIQKEFKNIQKRITGTVMEGASSNGKVKAAVNGERRLMSLSIEPDVLQTSSSRDVEKMVIEAVNDAGERIKSFSTAEMKKLTGGLDIPGLGGLL